MDEQMNADVKVDDQVQLSEIEPGDRAACVRHLTDREIYDRTLRIPHPYTADDFDHWLRMVTAARERFGEPVHFAVRLADHGLIGGVGFEELVPGHRAELGYWLARAYWGQGIMTGVVGRICRHAQDRWQLVRIAAEVFSTNAASARVLEKNGFRYEGTLHKRHRKDGRYLDACVYALVR